MKIFKGVLLVVIGLVFSTQAFAACVSGDLAGTYQVYSSGANSRTFVVTQCTLRVDAQGNVRRSGNCESTTGNSSVRGGKLRIKSNCNVTGNFRTNRFRITILEALMDRSKDGIGGSFRDQRNGTVGTFNAIKR